LTCASAENSEVSPIAVPLAVPLVFVAVALTKPTSGRGLMQVKVASPLALVAVVVVAARTWPYPCFEGSPSARSHWMVYDWVGLLSSVPVMVVVEPEMLVVAEGWAHRARRLQRTRKRSTSIRGARLTTDQRCDSLLKCR
jgi:hypothetical protein